MSSYITTYTGKHFEPTNPDQEAICIEDIAHALSLITRGNGHVKTFWSVGEHCLCCAKEAAARGFSDRLVLGCLLHDRLAAGAVARTDRNQLPAARTGCQCDSITGFHENKKHPSRSSGAYAVFYFWCGYIFTFTL